MARILVVEDDRMLSRSLTVLLKSEGYAVDCAGSMEDAFELECRETYQLLICDVGLPGISGFDGIRQLRARGVSTPILVLTARAERDDRIRGLDLGGDDYIVKPFDAAEMLAHVRALIRRATGNGSSVLTVGLLVCDAASTSASVGDRALPLPRREWSVLWALASRAGKVVPKERLHAEVFDYDDPVGSNAVEVYITRLRKKLAPDGPAIRSLRGLGYIMDAR